MMQMYLSSSWLANLLTIYLFTVEEQKVFPCLIRSINTIKFMRLDVLSLTCVLHCYKTTSDINGGKRL